MRFYLDVTLVLLFLLGMEYQFTGVYFHEVCGILFIILVIIHFIINQKNLMNPFADYYVDENSRLMKNYMWVVDILLVIDIIFLGLTGIFISKTIFHFPENPLALRIHAFSAYWAVVLIGMHIGLNFIPIVSGAMQNWEQNDTPPKGAIYLFAFLLFFGFYGAGIFALGDFVYKLFMLDRTSFINTTPNAILTFINNASLVAFWGLVGYQGCVFFGRRPKK